MIVYYGTPSTTVCGFHSLTFAFGYGSLQSDNDKKCKTI